MMKKIILLMILMISVVYGYAQFPTYPTVKQSLGSKSTEVYSKGILSADSGYVQSVFADTTAANRGYIKNIAGITIRVADTVYFRNAARTKWISLSLATSTPNLDQVTTVGNATTNDISIGALDVSTDGTFHGPISVTGTSDLNVTNIRDELLLSGITGTSGQTLFSQGAGVPPIWGTITTTTPTLDQVTTAGNTTYNEVHTGTLFINSQGIAGRDGIINTGDLTEDRDITIPDTSGKVALFGSGSTTNYLQKLGTKLLVNSQIFDNGNVGIGTAVPNIIISGGAAQPGKILQVRDASDISRFMLAGFGGADFHLVDLNGPSNYKDLRGINSGGVFTFMVVNDAGGGLSTSDVMSFNLNGGNVGIGNANNSYKLDVTGTLRNTTSAYFATTSGSVGIGTTTPDASSILELNTTSKGLLIPRMTGAQRTAISSPATGLIIYNTSDLAFNYWDGAAWQVLLTSVQGDLNFVGLDGDEDVDGLKTFLQDVTVSGGNSFIAETASGTNRNVALSTYSFGDDLGYSTLRTSSGTNTSVGLGLIPRGAGFAGSSGTQSSIGLYNTDFIADNANYEVLTINAGGTGGYGILGDIVGTGTLRPITISATGSFGSPAPNLYLTTGGSVGVNNSSPNSTLHTNGSFATAYVAKTGTYTATINDHTINCTSGTFTIDLPTAANITGRMYVIKNTGAGTITIDGSGSETIDGSTTKTLSVQYTGYQIQSDGTNWIITSAF